MISRLFRDRSGFGVNIEPLICVVIIAIIAAVAVPSILRTVGDGNQVGRSFQCMKNLLLIQRGQPEADVQQRACPVAEKPYRITERDGGSVLSCPDPAQHLGFDFHLVHDGESWKLDATLPDSQHPENGSVEVRGAQGAILRASADSVTILRMPDWAMKYVVLPAGIFFIALLLVPGIYLSLSLIDDLRQSGWGLFRALVKVPVIIALSLIGLFTLYDLGVDGLGGERVTLSSKEGVVIQSYWVGKAWTDPTRIARPVGVYPVLGERTFKAILFYETDGDVRHRELFAGSRDKWKVVSLMHDVLPAPR